MPPCQSQFLKPTKRRNLVKGSEKDKTFLNPLNYEETIEPTRLPDSLTSTPTQENENLENLENLSGSLNLKAPDTKAPDPRKRRNTPSPLQVIEGYQRISVTKGKQPQMSDATEGQDLGSKATIDEQLAVNNPAPRLGRKRELKQSRARKQRLNPGKVRAVKITRMGESESAMSTSSCLLSGKARSLWAPRAVPLLRRKMDRR